MSGTLEVILAADLEMRSYLTYDVITDLAFGKALGFVDSGRDIFQLIRSFEVGMSFLGPLAKMYPFTQRVLSSWIGRTFLMPSEKDKLGFGAMMRVAHELFQQRLEDLEHHRAVRPDLLQA